MVAVALGGGVYGAIKEKREEKRLADEEAAKRTLLENLSVTVFVRESNGSKTDLEYHLEQELISRGARVLVAKQQAGVDFIKNGSFTPLHPEAHFSVIGTLISRTGINKQVEKWTEDEHEFKVRKENHRIEMEKWRDRDDVSISNAGAGPKPILKPRESEIVIVPAIHYQFSFRVIGRDGAVLASGTSEEFPQANQVSYEKTFKILASEAISKLDTTDVWKKIVIE